MNKVIKIFVTVVIFLMILFAALSTGAAYGYQSNSADNNLLVTLFSLIAGVIALRLVWKK